MAVLPRTARGTSRAKERGANKATRWLRRVSPLAALCRASSALHSSERLLAFLGDLYVLSVHVKLTTPWCSVAGRMRHGIASDDSKTRVYSYESCQRRAPAELGAEVWRGNKPSSQLDMEGLGTPIRHRHFIASWAEGRMCSF